MKYFYEQQTQKFAQNLIAETTRDGAIVQHKHTHTQINNKQTLCMLGRQLVEKRNKTFIRPKKIACNSVTHKKK